MKTDYNILEKVRKLCYETSVSFELNYCGSDNTFYFVINSVFKKDEWIGKNYHFELACECVIEKLEEIQKERPDDLNIIREDIKIEATLVKNIVMNDGKTHYSGEKCTVIEKLPNEFGLIKVEFHINNKRYFIKPDEIKNNNKYFIK